MNKKHAKCPFCGAKIIKYGRKRKRCTQCKKTWTIRPRRRGRKARRLTATPIKKYLRHERVPLTKEHRGAIVPASRSTRLRKERDKFIEREHWLDVPGIMGTATIVSGIVGIMGTATIVSGIVCYNITHATQCKS